MADKVDPETRRRIMGRVASKDTPAEIAVRRALHAAGYRFRLHRKDLPGTPDIVLPRHRVAVFVHGCFWHQHQGCRRSLRPTSNEDYWNAKLDRNVRRDRENAEALARLGWRVLTVWECETHDSDRLLHRFQDGLE